MSRTTNAICVIGSGPLGLPALEANTFPCVFHVATPSTVT